MSLRENFSHNDMERWLDEHRVTEIECLVPDLTGVPRGKILPREKFTEDRGMRLPEAVVGMTVTGDCPDDSEDYDSVISVNDRDMLLLPDPGTVRLVPWAVDPTAQVIHDCYFSNGHLVDFAPRSVLRHVLDLYKRVPFRAAPVGVSNARTAPLPQPEEPGVAELIAAGRGSTIALDGRIAER